jgi:hypothetical protein
MPINVCLTVEIVERKGPISVEEGHGRVFDETCETWDKWKTAVSTAPSRDSGEVQFTDLATLPGLIELDT